jgi:hypothetical protein
MDTLSKAKNQLGIFTRWMREKVEQIATQSYPLQLAQWRKEIDLIRNQVERPDRIRIALIGSTGAGKSTFLNAVLGQEILPVGVMSPCTAFVTLVRQSSSPGYTVEIEFCTREEWRSEVESFAAYLTPGDTEQVSGDGESRRLIDAARKRVQAVLGNAVSQDIAPQALLELPLPDEAERIFSAGCSQTLRFDAAGDMLNHLRGLIRGESILWPLVKQVSISGPYDCLSGGLELVDLPGLNDPNAARVEVTREFLRTSPFVWVMFPMVRGLTQDVKIILEEEKLLRTLVFAGTYSALSLIGTKADDVDVNIAPQLGLDEDCEMSELIREYCRQTKSEARAQLVQMVRDLATPADAGETLDRMLDLANKVTVHTTSASAYMKIKGIGRLRRDYGLEKVDDTGIPGIHEHLARIAREAGADFNATMAMSRLGQLASEIAFFFRAEAQAGSPEADNARQRIRDEQENFIKAIASAQTESRLRLEGYRENFLQRVTPLLAASIQGVRNECQKWAGIHWSTLRAIVQRDGVFKSPATGKFYDLNGDLTEPLMSQLPVSWERYFTDDLGRVTESYVVAVTKEGTHFCERVRLIIDLLFHRKNELMERQLAWFQDKIKLLAQSAQNRILSAVTQRRSELAVKIPLVARNYMIPAYNDAKNESGRGMKARILDRISEAAVQAAPPIYDTIQKDLLEGLRDLDAVILGLFEELARSSKEQAGIVAHNAGIDIDEAAIDPVLHDLLASLEELQLKENASLEEGGA